MSKKNIASKIKNEYLGRTYATFCGLLIVVLTLAILIFVFSKGISSIADGSISIREFLFTKSWDPSGEPAKFGALVFIVGSTLVSIGAIVISAPIAIALAIFINFISNKLGDRIIKPALELFVGIPSVVYGWIGISFLVPLLKNTVGGLGFSLLAGILVLSIMTLPTIASITSDSLAVIPHEYVEASYGLGATRWQTISKVILPSARSGILTAIVLGIARAFGEALAVQMVIGNSVKFPSSITDITSTLTGILTMEMANTATGSQWNNALWTLASLLLLISFVFIIIIRFIGKRGEVK